MSIGGSRVSWRRVQAAQGRGQRKLVALAAQARDHPDGDVGEIRPVPERLARVDVRQVHFDERDSRGQQGVTQRDAGVREGRRVEEDEADAVRRGAVDPRDQFVLGVALGEVEAVTFAESGLDGGKRVGAVDPRLAGAEQVQVRAIEYQDGRHHAARLSGLARVLREIAANCREIRRILVAWLGFVQPAANPGASGGDAKKSAAGDAALNITTKGGWRSAESKRVGASAY